MNDLSELVSIICDLSDDFHNFCEHRKSCSSCEYHDCTSILDCEKTYIMEALNEKN